jgi:hypothetical protein
MYSYKEMPLPTVISFANIGYRDFSENLLRNAQDVLKNHTLILYCLDKELYDALQPYANDRIKLVLYDSTPVSTNFENYGCGNFNSITQIKINIILSALAEYGFIHFVDGDVVFCKEPTEEYYEPYSDYDIVYQRDAPPPNNPFCVWTCTGNFVLRNTERTQKFLQTISEYQRASNGTKNEQESQYNIFEDAGITDIREYPHARLTEFPDSEFTCGWYVRENAVDFSKIIVFHANHVTGSHAKLGLLQKIGKWYM